MTRSDPDEILHRASLNAGPLLAYLGEDATAARLGWPAGAVRAAQAHPKLRRRLALALGRRLDLAPHDLRRAAELLPRGEEALGRARLMFGLTVALASHAGVFRRADYGRLHDEFGQEALAFAMKQRSRLPAEARLPRTGTDRAAVEALGRVEFHRALHAAGHPLARVLEPEPAGAGEDGDEATPAPEPGPAAPVRAGPAVQVGRPALLADLAEAALAAAGLASAGAADGPPGPEGAARAEGAS